MSKLDNLKKSTKKGTSNDEELTKVNNKTISLTHSAFGLAKETGRFCESN